MQKALFFTLLFTFSTCLFLPAQSTIDSLDAALTELAQDGYFSGNLLLAEGDQILLRKAYGYSDFENGVPLQEDAVLELASVSKQFTAAAVALLVKDGKVDMDEPIASYLPELTAYPELTTRHLIHHTGGLPDYMTAVSELEEVPEFVTNKFFLDYFSDTKPTADFEPGERFEYSNTGYLILASLIDRISGQSFSDFMRERIFLPLKMNDSQIYRRRYEADRKVVRFVPGYVWDGENFVIPDSMEELSYVKTLDGIYGDGMVNSTLDDLRRWDRALADGQFIDTTLLFTPGKTNEGESTGYAFGQGVRQHPKYGYIISHSGGWPGMNTFIYRFPETDRLLILLRNDDGGRSKKVNILRNALHALHGIPLETESLQPPLYVLIEESIAREYVGTYVIMPEFKIDLFLNEAGELFTQATGQVPIQVTATEQTDRLTLTEVEAEMQFNRDENGKIVSVTLFQGGQEVEAKREE